MKKILFVAFALVALNACKHANSKAYKISDKAENINPADTVGWGKMHINLAEGGDMSVMQFRQLESQYLRRTYLIGNLVKVLRSNGAFSDKSKLDDLDSAKESASRFYINENHLDSANVSQYRLVQQRLSGAFDNVYVAIYKIHDILDDKNLSTTLRLLGSNKSEIDSERKKYNDYVKEYNGNLSKFNVLAEKVGFKKMPFFESPEMMQSSN